jgi:hypothetical protein
MICVIGWGRNMGLVEFQAMSRWKEEKVGTFVGFERFEIMPDLAFILMFDCEFYRFPPN